MQELTKTKCIHIWRDRVLFNLKNAIERAEPTGSSEEPTAIASFSIELLQNLVDEAPIDNDCA